MASVLQYTSQNQLNESQVDNFLAESGDSNADLEQFLNRDHMPKLTLKQFYEAVGLDINNSAAFGELNEGEIEVGELSQDVLNLEDSDDQSQANTTIAQYIISSLKSQQKQFYDDMCQAIKSEIDQASSHCQIFENIVKSTGSLVIENYTNMLEKDRPEFEKSIRANFDDLKNSQLEEFLNKMEDGLNQYESKLLDLIPVLDKSVKNIEDYSFVVAQIKEKLESHFDDLTKQLKAEERENIGVESYRTQIAETKSATEHATLEDSELSTKNSELSEKLDELKSKLLELEKEEKTLQSQVSRLSPDTHLFSKREYSRLNAKYRELISETSIEPKSISENSLLFLLDDQVEIFLSNPKQGGLDYKSLNLKLVEFYTEEQKQILNSFISRLEAYIKANKTHLKLRGLLKFVSKAWHQFHLILEKLSHPKLEPIAKLEVYPLEYYSVTSTSPIFFLQTTLTVHNDIGTETRNEIVVTNKFTIDDMLKFPNCLGTVKAEKTSGNVK
jgi:chromosome segregation ATPase